MTKEKLTARAQAGDAQAMLALVDVLREEGDLIGAIRWADAAASASPTGMLKAAQLHHFRLVRSLEAGEGYWDLMREDIRKCRKNAADLVMMSRKGSVTLAPGSSDYLIGLIRDCLYGDALICYVDGSHDLDRITSILKDISYAREQLLYALALSDRQEHDRAFSLMGGVWEDTAYVRAEKWPAEEYVFAVAMFRYAAQHRVKGNLYTAVSVLNRCVGLVRNPEMNAWLQAELNRYSQTTYGRWQYNG